MAGQDNHFPILPQLHKKPGVFCLFLEKPGSVETHMN
jgi:hypothetical protein